MRKVYNNYLRGGALDDFNFLIYIFVHCWESVQRSCIIFYNLKPNSKRTSSFLSQISVCSFRGWQDGGSEFSHVWFPYSCFPLKNRQVLLGTQSRKKDVMEDMMPRIFKQKLLVRG